MHTDFIISDIFDILDDAVMSASAISPNIAHYPLCEYLLQSIFLRLTGYQEQKLKCILWEIASDDFEFRYKYLNGTIKVGECSQLEHKNIVYIELKEILEKKGYEYHFPDESEVNRQITEIREKLNRKFDTTIFKIWLPRDYSRYIEFSNRIKGIFNGNANQGYFSPNNIFGGDNLLKDAYEKAYRHRNRCAHNLLSYQNNVPTLLDITNDSDGLDNYFTRIFLICLIDNVFTQMFKSYVHNR